MIGDGTETEVGGGPQGKRDHRQSCLNAQSGSTYFCSRSCALRVPVIYVGTTLARNRGLCHRGTGTRELERPLDGVFSYTLQGSWELRVSLKYCFFMTPWFPPTTPLFIWHFFVARATIINYDSPSYGNNDSGMKRKDLARNADQPASVIGSLLLPLFKLERRSTRKSHEYAVLFR